MSSNEKFEREFDAFLDDEDSRLAALYRKLPQPEPDARLDAAVRAMAHRALNPQLVATPQGSRPARRVVRWVPALGVAAGIVLAAGIAFRLGPSLNDTTYHDRAPGSDVISVRQLDVPASATPPPLSPAPPPAASAPTAAALARPPPGQAEGNAPAMPLAPPGPAPVVAAKSIREEDQGKTQRPSATPEQRRDAAAPVGNAQGIAKAKPSPRPFPPELDHGRPPTARQLPAIDAVERKPIVTPGARQNVHERDARDAGSDAARTRSLDDKDDAAATKSPAAGAVMPAPAPPAAPPLAADRAVAPHAAEVEAEPGATIETERMAAPASPPPAAAARPTPAAGGRVAPQAAGEAVRERAENQPERGMLKKERAKSDDPNARLYPESWLAKIRGMFEEGHRDEALRSLTEFRRLYPDYRLPDDLRDLK